MQPLRHLGFDHRDESTTTTESPAQTETQTENSYKGLTPKECRKKVEEDPLPKMEPWYFYPVNSECYHFAIWEHFKMVTWQWKTQWFKVVCDNIHEKHAFRKAKELKEILKKTHCNPELN